MRDVIQSGRTEIIGRGRNKTHREVRDDEETHSTRGSAQPCSLRAIYSHDGFTKCATCSH